MAYVWRVQALAESGDPSPLLAHAYVRYLGDLSGGQFIKRRIVKAYELEDGFGTTFYDFKPLGGSGTDVGTIGDMKKIKEWYREGMNAGVGDNQALKGEAAQAVPTICRRVLKSTTATILAEANIAFQFNSGLFAALRSPTAASSSASEDKSSATATAILSGTAQADRMSQERIYTIASVISFIAALSLAHIYMIFNGSNGRGCPTKKIHQYSTI